MPGNEVGDRVHNFFQQGSLSQSQHNTQAVEGHWAVFNNNLWRGTERQIGRAFNSKNYNVQQSDVERGQCNQFSLGQYGLNLTQNNVRPEFTKSQSQNQQLTLNGFMHASQVSHARQNEANVFGMDRESDRHNLMSKGLPGFESENRSGPQHSNTDSANFGAMEAPVNFDFLGGQGNQQMSNQQAGILQSGINDAQLFQQQVMLKQMQELQRHQQLQQLEAMQRNSVNQMSAFPNQVAGNHSSAFINDTPMHDGANYPWSSQVMAGNTNWLLRGVSAGAQGYSNGLMIAPEHGQALRMMGLMPQQPSQSLYGVPVSSTRAASPFLHNPTDKPGMHQVPVQSSSLSSNHHALFPEQVGMREGTTVPRPGFENKSSFEHASGHGSSNLVNVENIKEIQPNEVQQPEYGGRGDAAGSAKSIAEKTEKQVASSQAAVALDPTEEKILFGSDDNIWEAFGGSLTSGSHNHLDGGFPSLQSGSWSALMQSAVAESTSSDIGLQGEWGGVGVQKSASLGGNQQPSLFHDSGKQEAACVDCPQAASLSSRPFPDDAGLSSNYPTSSVVQQSISDQPRGSLQTRSSEQSERRKWLDRSQLQVPAEGRQVPENAYSSTEFNSRGITGLWTHQQNRSLHGCQPSNGQGDLNFMESMPQNGGTTSRKPDNLHGGDCGGDPSTNLVHGGVMSRLDSVRNPNAGMESPKLNGKDEAVLHDSSNIKVGQEPSQKLLDNHQFNFWRSVGSSVKPGFDDSRKYRHQLNKGVQIFDSSVSSSDRGAAEMHEAGNADKRENSSDSHGSNLSRHAPSGSLRDNVWSDAGETRSLQGGMQKSSGDASRKTPAPRKFQYHPMGDVDMDVEPAYGAKHTMQAQAMNHPLSRGLTTHEGHLRFLHTIPNNSLDSEGCVSNAHGGIKVPYGVSPSSIRTGYGPGAPAFVDRSSSDKPMPSSQNMLELLHKVDQSKEQSGMGQFNTNKFSGIREAEASDRTVGLSPKQSSASQSFGLQLAPPSQGLVANLVVASQNSPQNVNSPGSNSVTSDRADKAHSWLASPAFIQVPSSLCEVPEGEYRNNQFGIPGQTDADASPQNMQGNFSSPFASSSLYLRSLLQNQRTTDAGGKIINEQPGNASFDGVSHGKLVGDSQDQAHSAHVLVYSSALSISNNDRVPQKEISQITSMDQSDAGVSMHQTTLMDVSAAREPSFMYGTSQRGNLSTIVPNVPTDIATAQVSGVQSHNASDWMKSQCQSNHFVEASLYAQQKQYDQDTLRRGSSASSLSVASGDEQPARATDPEQNTARETQGKGSSMTQDDSLPKSASTLKHIEAFGRSLRPNNNLRDNYSLLHQMQAMKSTEVDHGDRHLKIFKGPDNGPDAQQIAGRVGQMFSVGSVNHQLVSSGDGTIPSYPPEPGNDEDKSSTFQQLRGHVSAQDMLSHGRGDSQKLIGNDITPRAEHPHISPQMAPSWFEQYGTFRNGQLLPMHDACRSETITGVEQQSIIGKSSPSLVRDRSVEQVNAVVDTGQIANAWNSTTASVLSDQISSHPSIPGVASLRPKKRRSATADLLPWHKEVAVGLQWLQSISSAEAEWTQSANRLIETEDETDMNEDVLPSTRSKRRLILTTQLTQQVLRPPPAAILSLEASSNYETVVYSVARLALGDACSLTCSLESDSRSDSGNLMPEKRKTSGRICDQYFSKVVGDLVTRAMKLEDDLLRLDKRGSMLDLRLECQDLERFSVINRFAKFHGRGQVDGAETSSSSGSIATAQRPSPQRYVTAHPVPRNLPDGVHCLTL